MKKVTTPLRVFSRHSVKSIASLGAILSLTAAFFSANVHAQGGGGGGLWQANGSSIVYTNRFVGFGLNNPSERVEILGGFLLHGNAYIDSLLTALSVQTGGLTTGSLLVTGNSQLNGLLNIGSTLILDGTNSSISSTTGTVDFLNSNITTTGSINASQYLINGLPLISSQWTSSGSNIFYSGGNVGINTSNPSFSLEVDGSAAITGTLFVDRIEAQSHISIGQFRFINGAIQPGEADTIHSAARIVVRSESERIALKADTVTVKGRLGVGVEKPVVALDVKGDIRSTGTITANNIKVDTANFTRLVTNRIVSPDSIISFGDSSVDIYHNINNIRGSTLGTYKGLGLGVIALGRGLFSTGLGFIVIAEAEKSIIIGSGILSPFTIFKNTIPNSLMIGFNSDIPTIFVGPSSGVGTSGAVGIGTSTPMHKLHVNGQLKLDGNGAGIFIEAGTNDWFIGRSGSTGSKLRFYNNGDRMTISPNGNVGIGDNNPSTKLDINGNIRIKGSKLHVDLAGRVGIGTSSPEEKLHVSSGNILLERGFFLKSKRNGNLTNLIGVLSATRIIGIGEASTFPDEVRIFTPTDTDQGVSIHNGTDYIAFFRNDGNVGIGTTNPGSFKLAVCGDIRTERVVVDIGWCDYVFEDGYKLMSLPELEKYIKQNKHLPGFPPAEEVEKNGADLGEIATLQQVRMEENTVHLIDHNKRIDVMEQHNKEKDREIELLKEENKELKDEKEIMKEEIQLIKQRLEKIETKK